MIDLLAKKTTGGDLSISLARQYLLRHEWGLARMAVEEGFARGNLTEPEQAHSLFTQICQCLGLPAADPMGGH